MLSPSLLTAETSAIVLLDYQEHVINDIHSHDHELIELNGQALARTARSFHIPAVLSTIGVELRGDPPTIPAILAELPDEPVYDRTTMNAWDDDAVREAVARTGRRRLIFAGLWTEVCLLYPVLQAQREGFETYFVVDAVGGSTVTAHDTAVSRMVQAGSQPLTLGSLQTELLRDWKTSPHTAALYDIQAWYAPAIERVRKRLAAEPATTIAI